MLRQGISGQFQSGEGSANYLGSGDNPLMRHCKLFGMLKSLLVEQIGRFGLNSNYFFPEGDDFTRTDNGFKPDERRNSGEPILGLILCQQGL
jgi:hypothetical protein